MRDHLSRLWKLIIEYNILIVLIILVLVSSAISPAFLTERNILNLLRQVSGLGIISMGMLLVILTGGIDLSVGSVLAVGSTTLAWSLGFLPLPLAVLFALLAGSLLGSASGMLVAKTKMAPFVATLAMMTIGRGSAFILSQGHPIITNSEGLEWFGRGYFLRVPLPVVLMLAVFLLCAVLLRQTVFGRLVTAIGSNESAVRLAGIRVNLYKFSVYAICGACSAIAGVISTARTGVGSPVVGVGIELDAIAAVVIGGARLSGGRGTAFNTLLGVLVLGLIGNVMNLLSVPAYPQQLIKGLIIIVAVLMQGVKKNDV
jgi:ribose transport system permease protein